MASQLSRCHFGLESGGAGLHSSMKSMNFLVALTCGASSCATWFRGLAVDRPVGDQPRLGRHPRTFRPSAHGLVRRAARPRGSARRTATRSGARRRRDRHCLTRARSLARPAGRGARGFWNRRWPGSRPGTRGDRFGRRLPQPRHVHGAGGPVGGVPVGPGVPDPRRDPSGEIHFGNRPQCRCVCCHVVQGAVR